MYSYSFVSIIPSAYHQIWTDRIRFQLSPHRPMYDSVAVSWLKGTRRAASIRWYFCKTIGAEIVSWQINRAMMRSQYGCRRDQSVCGPGKKREERIRVVPSWPVTSSHSAERNDWLGQGNFFSTEMENVWIWLLKEYGFWRALRMVCKLISVDLKETQVIKNYRKFLRKVLASKHFRERWQVFCERMLTHIDSDLKSVREGVERAIA